MQIQDAARWKDYAGNQTHVRVKFEQIERTVTYFDYGCADQKGRVVGGFKALVAEKVIQRTDDKSGYILTNEQIEALNDDGMRYGYEVSSTRDGQAFGASSRTKWFKTPEDAEKAADKAVENARKRAQKKFG